MKINAPSPSPLPFFSPRVLLLAALVSGVLVLGSAVTLLVTRVEDGTSSVWARTYNAVEMFWRDTIRLSFTNRRIGGVAPAVFVAPPGLLDQKTPFNWLDEAQRVEPPADAAPPPPQAPVRLLDPAWQPSFSGGLQDKDAQ